MPTKKELLEEKNVEQLEEMAKDKNLEGYSELEKSELIDLLADNYRKEEIEAWPMLGAGGIESISVSEAEEKVGRDDINFEDLEVEQKAVGSEIDPIYVMAVFGAATAVAVAILLLYLGQ